MKFILQVDKENRFPSADVAAIKEAIDEINWLHRGEDPIVFDLKKIEEIVPERVRGEIPVGSIEFVEKYLKENYGIPAIKPLFIPQSLQKQEYLNRRIGLGTADDLRRAFDEWKTKKLFVKSGSCLKCDFADVYEKRDKVPEEKLYFYSEPIDIVSEWRCFVYRNRLQDIKNYSGDWWALPDKNFVEKTIAQLGYGAYTMDVAVIRNKDGINNAVIEVHDFVSCGLYGFAELTLPAMLKEGFKQVIATA